MPLATVCQRIPAPRKNRKGTRGAASARAGGTRDRSEGERVVPSDGPALLGDPWIRRATTTGTYTGQLWLPPQLHTNSQEFGPRKNQTLEGVTFTPDGRRIVTAMEDPLSQDGDAPPPSTARGGCQM